ncbi:unnamed protein product [Adineta ricciae]|uniref:non-specific serine/threonine protein kinase n=1 Tax=Adineta ricciae TaxID=249248 RepID=A0A816BID1_ADIRI|nr:unnamed protein product [Adineta ricciae]
MNRLLEDLWLGNSMRWFVPPPPPVFFHGRHTPFHPFFDRIHPVFDRLSPAFSDDNPHDYYNLYVHRPPSRMPDPFLRSAKTLKPFNREYVTSTCLGKGGFGQVYDGRRRLDNVPVVMKFLPKDRILNWGMFEDKRVPYEIELLWRLRGLSGVIRIFEHFEEPERFIFIMEKIPNSCTLFHFVMESTPLANTELLRHIFREMIRINIALRAYGIWHRDCKLENILYCKNDRSLCFIDFGSAAPAQTEDFYEFQGTLETMVPEWITQKRYDGERSCVWALGICLYFLLFQQYPFRSKVAIINGRSQLPFLSSSDKDAYHTMKQCLHPNEHRRPKLDTLQSLPWLD